MYYEYWGMNRHPFDNVPDPTMYFRAHESVETAVAEVLFAVEEGDEVLAVIVGEVGLGKTTTLRVVLDSLDHDKYRIAFVTNPDVTFSMLLREIVGQLRGEPCEIRRKDDLLEEFNHILFETADEGKRVLIFIDEGNAFKAVNLESLRLLTNMQEDDRNLFTIVLAGQPKLAKMLEAPSRANLFQRIGVYCHLKQMENWQTVRDYIDHRLERAGTTDRVFTDEAVEAIFEYSEGGVPRLVNKICKLALKAGETNALGAIDAELVSAIGERFKRHTRPEKTSKKKEEVAKAPKVEEAPPEASEAADTAQLPVLAEEKQETPLEEVFSGNGDKETSPTKIEPAIETAGAERGFAPTGSYDSEQLGFVDEGAVYPGSDRGVFDDGPQRAEDIDVSVEQVCLDDALRPDVIEKAKNASKVERMKMAGQLAAEEIKKHPEVVNSDSDPVEMWKELRNEILSALSAEVNS